MPASTQTDLQVVVKAAQVPQSEKARQDGKPEQVRLLPDQIAPPVKISRGSRWLSISFVVIVVVPTILAGIYYALVASDQYETRTLFAVRGLSNSSSALDNHHE